MIELGVNIDHVATVRQARRTYEPDPVIAAALAEQGGADGITFHLREDRRHIQERDVELLVKTVTVRTNFEIAATDEVVAIACRVKPTLALLVPESRQEVTTEGGLDVRGDTGRIATAVKRLKDAGIMVSLFLDPDEAQIDAAAVMGVDAVELHTGPYAHAAMPSAGHAAMARELARLRQAGKLVVDAGMRFHAGHGLNYANVRPVAQLPSVTELNIGHSIIARALMVGMRDAVAQMRQILDIAAAR
jgi:pyridoxine 5-phosphate synthase